MNKDPDHHALRTKCHHQKLLVRILLICRKLYHYLTDTFVSIDYGIEFFFRLFHVDGRERENGRELTISLSKELLHCRSALSLNLHHRPLVLGKVCSATSHAGQYITNSRYCGNLLGIRSVGSTEVRPTKARQAKTGGETKQNPPVEGSSQDGLPEVYTMKKRKEKGVKRVSLLIQFY